MMMHMMPESQSARSEHPWIEDTQFEAMSQTMVLKSVLGRVSTEVAKYTSHGGKPVTVVFDLDSTVFDVKPRTLRILKEFARTKEARELNPRLCEWCAGITAHSLLYTLKESAIANDFPMKEKNAEAFLKTAFPYWKARFFTDRYVLEDHPTPGAVDYVRRVMDLGASIVYLTGRDTPGMGRGTRSILKHWGFPVDTKEARLIMKPNAGADDAEFKDAALRELRTHSEVVALFDNEPSNFHVFERNFPEAMLVFFHSNCSSKSARKVNKIYKVENFLL